MGTCIVKVVANLKKSTSTLTKNILYPHQNQIITFTLTNIESDPKGGPIQYKWKFDAGAWSNPNTNNFLAKGFAKKSYTLVAEAYNLDDSITLTLPFSVYPACPSVVNGNFQSNSNVSPWLWDLDWHWDTPGGVSGWTTDELVNSSANYLVSSEEQVTNVQALGRNNSKCAIIGDTTTDTGNWWVDADIQQTSGTLTSTQLNLVNGPQYKLSTWVYRGDNCTTKITLTMRGVGNNAVYAFNQVPSESGWHQLFLYFTLPAPKAVKVQFFKGENWTTTDMGEVRFDDITLSYNN